MGVTSSYVINFLTKLYNEWKKGTGTAGLPGKVISFYIGPLDPAYQAGLAGQVPAKKKDTAIL